MSCWELALKINMFIRQNDLTNARETMNELVCCVGPDEAERLTLEALDEPMLN
jgi:hypothetical protein